MELDSRVALVTGAGARVGRVIALALGKAGMRVGVHYFGSEKGARATAEEIIAGGGDAVTLPGDLTDPATCLRLVEHTTKVLGSGTRRNSPTGPSPLTAARASTPAKACMASVWPITPPASLEKRAQFVPN